MKLQDSTKRRHSEVEPTSSSSSENTRSKKRIRFSNVTAAQWLAILPKQDTDNADIDGKGDGAGSNPLEPPAKRLSREEEDEERWLQRREFARETLRHQIADPETVVMLELLGREGSFIRSAHRIAVSSGGWRQYARNEFYHVYCFFDVVGHAEAMELVASHKFRLSPASAWGLMVRKWFEHQGSIRLDKLAAYIEAYRSWEKAWKACDSEFNRWSSAHFHCTEEGWAGQKCGGPCPPRPTRPAKPILKRDYMIGDEGSVDGYEVYLWDVLRHPNLRDLPPWIDGPEIEEQVAHVDEEAGAGESLDETAGDDRA
ncbi:hypothetical protein B0T22DRAFT_440783 [Podospora appendiculata]|uniref:Uncharacterized protein n=1 Tax=Podospora appendiculata TaxID=314037 RepID=A0AAE1CD39_9PEZI|nr:hypothetical protein B0T22DRAFT_440783 [Podospora appendiculata]